MRKILSFAAIAAFVLSCSSCNKQVVPEQGEGTVIKRVSVDLGGSTRTRAASALAGEATINDATLFVWQHNGVSEPVLYAKTYAEATVFNFDLMFSDQTEYTYTINAWANMGELSAEPADSEVLFSNESADGVQMKGSKTGITQAIAESVTIDMQRYVGKITVSEVAVEWTNEQNALQEFTLKSMYIANAGDKAEGAVATYNVGGAYVSSAMDAMLYSPVSSVIADGAKYTTPQMMYAYGSGTTELVLECDLGGQTMYYHVPYEPEANTHRAFKLTIRQAGADEPLGELPEEAIVANVTTLNVVGFDESEESVDFGEESKNSTVYNEVDLGLPSGLKWADRNIGASGPKDAGLYFQWGDTQGWTAEQIANGEKEFNWNTYFDTSDGGQTFNKYGAVLMHDVYDDEYEEYWIDDSNVRLKSEDDAATVHMGEGWYTPNLNDYFELYSNTIVNFIDNNNKEWSWDVLDFGTDNFAESNATLVAMKFTSKSNGNTLVIPLTGYYNNNNLIHSESVRLWTNSVFKEYSGYLDISEKPIGVNNQFAEAMVYFSSDRVIMEHDMYSQGNFNIDGSDTCDFVKLRCLGLPIRGVHK